MFLCCLICVLTEYFLEIPLTEFLGISLIMFIFLHIPKNVIAVFKVLSS